MGYPIKTSNNEWLSKTIKLFNQRVSISITDDAGYKLSTDADIMKLFKRFTLSQTSLLIYGAFYLLAVVSLVLLYYSFSLQFSKSLGVTVSILSFIICTTIPTYFLVKNKAPKIIETENGFEIKFSSRVD